jgi:hypothetical protein
MLQAERQQPRRRQHLVDRMDFGAHEWVPLKIRAARLARRPYQTNSRPMPSAAVAAPAAQWHERCSLPGQAGEFAG